MVKRLPFEVHGRRSPNPVKIQPTRQGLTRIQTKGRPDLKRWPALNKPLLWPVLMCQQRLSSTRFLRDKTLGSIVNATYVFDEFAKKILKEGRKADGLTEAEIDKLCEDHKVTLLLWDGAFSTARTIDPTEDDIGLYKQFVYAAVVCHVRIGCNVTHKVHLMWKHVAVQMKVPGGLGQKMEDWLELQHQGGMSSRVQYRTMGDAQKSAEEG